MRPTARSTRPNAARPRRASRTSQSAGPMPTNTQRGCVDAPDGQDHEREQRGVAPPTAPHRAHGEPDQPGQTGPREQQHRDARGERQLVRREHVDERAADRAGARHAEHPEQPPGAERGGERDGAEPEALRDPVGHAGVVGEPVERAHREQVADDLVRHGAEPDVRVPEVRRPRQQAIRVEVQVLLGVGAHPARRRQQERDVGEEREPEELEAPVAFADGARRRILLHLHG